jgi:hypothetical protein
MSDVRKPGFGHAGQIEPRVAFANSLMIAAHRKVSVSAGPLALSSRSPPAASRIVIAAKNRVFQQYPPFAEVRLRVLGARRRPNIDHIFFCIETSWCMDTHKI